MRRMKKWKEIVLRKMKKMGMIENVSQMVVKVGIDIFTLVVWVLKWVCIGFW